MDPKDNISKAKKVTINIQSANSVLHGNKEDESKIQEAIKSRAICCPICLSQEFTNKGRAAKTNELRVTCVSCGKNSAALAAMNMCTMRTRILEMEAREAKHLEDNELKEREIAKNSIELESLRRVKNEQRDEGENVKNEDIVEKVLRGNSGNMIQESRVLNLYFSNIRANKIGDVRKVILAHTDLSASHMMNIDFASSDTLEIMCTERYAGLIATELQKLKLMNIDYNPAETDESLKLFHSRMRRTRTRRTMSKPLLKRHTATMSSITMETASLLFKKRNITYSEPEEYDMVNTNQPMPYNNERA